MTKYTATLATKTMSTNKSRAETLPPKKRPAWTPCLKVTIRIRKTKRGMWKDFRKEVHDTCSESDSEDDIYPSEDEYERTERQTFTFEKAMLDQEIAEFLNRDPYPTDEFQLEFNEKLADLAAR